MPRHGKHMTDHETETLRSAISSAMQPFMEGVEEQITDIIWPIFQDDALDNAVCDLEGDAPDFWTRRYVYSWDWDYTTYRRYPRNPPGNPACESTP